jgi:hypothetical protein
LVCAQAGSAAVAKVSANAPNPKRVTIVMKTS